jgi:hypothetical protein
MKMRCRPCDANYSTCFALQHKSENMRLPRPLMTDRAARGAGAKEGRFVAQKTGSHRSGLEACTKGRLRKSQTCPIPRLSLPPLWSL